jgi:hypothetical protein
MEGMTEQERVAVWLAAVVAEEAERLMAEGVHPRAAISLATFRAISLAARDDFDTFEDFPARLAGMNGGAA